jgi:hypothetical protein
MSVAKLFSNMNTDTREIFALESRRIIWILRYDFLNLTMDNLLREGVLAIPFDEISRLDNISNVSSLEIENLSQFETEILKVNLKACIRIAETFQQKNKMENAIQWLYSAKSASMHFSNAYHQLFNLLIKVGRLSEAYSVGSDALSMRPDAKQFIEQMEALALSLGHENDVDRWRSGHKAVPRDFEALISKMEKNRNGNMKPLSETSSLTGKVEDRRWSSFNWLKQKFTK